MSVSIAQNDGFIQITAAGGETSLDWDFPIFEKSHLRILQTTTGGTVTTLVLDTDYSIADAELEDEAGGTAVLNTGVYPSGATAGYKYTMLLDAPEARTTDFTQAGDFFAATLNRELDLITQAIQQLRRDVDKSLSIPEDSTVSSFALDALTANKMLIVNATADGITLSSSDFTDIEAELSTVAGISADVTTVAGISANVTTVAGISANVTTVAGISGNVTTVAGISANVTTVAGLSSEITTVAGLSSEIATLAAISTDITDAANNIPKANRTATVDPTVNDDVDLGYSAGSMWINTTTDTVFLCSDATDGAAQWANVSVTLGGLGDVTITSATTNDFMRYNGSAWVNVTLAEAQALLSPSNPRDYDGSNDVGFVTLATDGNAATGTAVGAACATTRGVVLYAENSGNTFRAVGVDASGTAGTTANALNPTGLDTGNYDAAICKMDDDKVLVACTDSSGGRIKLRAATVNTSTLALTFGTEIEETTPSTNVRNVGLAQISTDKALCAYFDDTNGLQCFIVTTSGTTVSASAAATLTAGTGFSDESIEVVKMTTDLAFVKLQTTTASNYYHEGFAVDVSGATPSALNNSTMVGLAPMAQNSVYQKAYRLTDKMAGFVAMVSGGSDVESNSQVAHVFSFNGSNDNINQRRATNVVFEGLVGAGGRQAFAVTSDGKWMVGLASSETGTGGVHTLFATVYRLAGVVIPVAAAPKSVEVADGAFFPAIGGFFFGDDETFLICGRGQTVANIGAFIGTIGA